MSMNLWSCVSTFCRHTGRHDFQSSKCVLLDKSSQGQSERNLWL